MKLTSTEFADGGTIPTRYACDGEGRSPALEIAEVPAGAQSLALIMDDPDAPRGVWDHWLIWNLAPTITRIPAGGSGGGEEGMNSWPKRGYGPPCPPSGEHRYYFRLYALDIRLELPPTTARQQLEAAMNGHILAQAELMGRYRRG